MKTRTYLGVCPKEACSQTLQRWGDVDSSCKESKPIKRPFVASAGFGASLGIVWLVFLWHGVGQVQGHEQSLSMYEPAGSRRFGTLGDHAGGLGVERLTNGCGGSCLLAYPFSPQHGKLLREQENNMAVEETWLMQQLVERPTRWVAIHSAMHQGLYRLWRHTFAARHFVSSDEFKSVKRNFHSGNERFQAFLRPLGEEKWILAQHVEIPPGHPPLRDIILYQDEHTYCLPIMMQVLTEDVVLQGTVILERPYATEWIDSVVLFAFWDPPCQCASTDCLVLLPHRADYGERVEVRPGSFVRLRCGPEREPYVSENSSCSTALGSPNTEVGGSPSTQLVDEEMVDYDPVDGGAHGLEDGDSHSLFQVETFMPVRTFDESILEMWRAHTEVRGLDRLNMDAMAYLWMERTAPLLRVRHVNFKYRTWTAAWGDIMALTPETLIPKVRAALHDDFAPSVDLWVGL